MRISALPIKNFANVNQFTFGNEWSIRAGDPNTLYFQLVDLDQNNLRYLAGISQTAGITVTFLSIDDSLVINITAIQNPNDKSIWSVVISPAQTINSGSVRFAISEGSDIRRVSIPNMIVVEQTQNEGGC